jgi:hypothetical protein
MTTLEEYRSKSVLLERLRAVQELAADREANLTLWVGAGFGKYYAGLPIWSELLTALCDDEVPEQDKQLIKQLIGAGRLMLAAELLTDIRSRRVLDHICRLCIADDVELERNPLAALSPGTVITTNYDLLLDHLFPDYRVLDPRHSVESVFTFAPKLIKIHGSISQPDSIVLNVTSYARAYNRAFEWFLIHIFQNTTVLFIGAGLSENEPYMRYIRLLRKSGLLRHHHYAVMPFGWQGDDDGRATNKTITDRGNQLEAVGVRILPYVVKEPADHQFFDVLLRELSPPVDADSLDERIRRLDAALESFGPDRIGPSLFRMFRSISDAQASKMPFLNLVAKFLRAIRDGNRLDLAAFWILDFEQLVQHQERQAREKFNGGTERQHRYKYYEVDRNKAFLFDVQRTLRPLARRSRR